MGRGATLALAALLAATVITGSAAIVGIAHQAPAPAAVAAQVAQAPPASPPAAVPGHYTHEED